MIPERTGHAFVRANDVEFVQLNLTSSDWNMHGFCQLPDLACCQNGPGIMHDPLIQGRPDGLGQTWRTLRRTRRSLRRWCARNLAIWPHGRPYGPSPWLGIYKSKLEFKCMNRIYIPILSIRGFPCGCN